MSIRIKGDPSDWMLQTLAMGLAWLGTAAFVAFLLYQTFNLAMSLSPYIPRGLHVYEAVTPE